MSLILAGCAEPPELVSTAELQSGMLTCVWSGSSETDGGVEAEFDAHGGRQRRRAV